MKYLYWNKDLRIVQCASDIWQMEIIDSDKEISWNEREKNLYVLNDTGMEIISNINGLNTYDDVIFYFVEKYKENPEDVKEIVDEYLNNVENEYGLKIQESEEVVHRQLEVICMKTMYPKAASVEITSSCNLKCRHCYGSYGTPCSGGPMPLEDVYNVLKQLSDIGVLTLELTGGDVTTHPHFAEILLYALSLNFMQIDILTNGVLLSQEVMDICIKNKNKIFVQIDLHSLDDSYHTWFTQVADTVEKIKEHILYLSNNGVYVRVISMVTDKNIDSVEDVAEWAYENKVKQYGCSMVVSVGRATEEEGLLLSYDNQIKYNQILENIKQKYTDFVHEADYEKRLKACNCGCLSSHVVINSKGDIKICTVDTLEYCDSSIGNVLDKNLKDIYDETQDYIRAFAALQAPVPQIDECRNCEHFNFCGMCIVRPLTMRKKIGDKCRWYDKYVPDIIKEKLSL